ncbi:hypothetical protein N7510_007578 [Penicillium lagena]|uniref:uncharacterized protein n=1 Tax=Penicillium lagena TaxID=94218 RepID=UPI0025411C24|nr:uncharacterized protein N7510_007578 [Penicillium lagena]KAJ5610859.1 hypothetical protein N7510_007578 [Penicillium lagena]
MGVGGLLYTIEKLVPPERGYVISAYLAQKNNISGNGAIGTGLVTLPPPLGLAGGPVDTGLNATPALARLNCLVLPGMSDRCTATTPPTPLIGPAIVFHADRFARIGSSTPSRHSSFSLTSAALPRPINHPRRAPFLGSCVTGAVKAHSEAESAFGVICSFTGPPSYDQPPPGDDHLHSIYIVPADGLGHHGPPPPILPAAVHALSIVI